MSFNWADDTDDAIAAGELPEFAGSYKVPFSILNEIAELRANVGEMIYKKLGMQNMGKELAARDDITDDEAKEKRKKEAKLWPSRGKWRVKRKSPLNIAMFS
ncbi:afbb97ed-4fb7-49ee-b8ef-5ffcc7f7bb0c [Sclerotinia trifoliorum]|uniref:Afbb97ed-4fb7-49ee-b8ef-5ffcc7f7bb0c n=1 Tax=Sclerotinia trifoliorum TaxID=28548 RepID=A0A8H2VXY9_9HELO|nr:afbb97ed-4fb7-49ee-b8ef-5ffcc7f7bb0c [Sclerotinia trifoliorum]